ncbi:hypothetical protein [Clostridioides difficile]|uniref:hypothetical protein n=1 Tax=Clostridioides difficile TaxID=1496 RepID=UPI00038C6A42|nr:hypothetical protein [Clostridioides difficile]EQH27381.1 hypothetical protein QM1_0989 [Clostridioides difficile DA00212]
MIRYIKDIYNISLEDADMLAKEGFCFIIKDGKLRGFKIEKTNKNQYMQEGIK